METPIEHRDVTTIMALLGDIQADVGRIRAVLEEDDGEEEEAEREPDSEDWARYHETRRMLAERIAYHEAKARAEEERRGDKRC